MKFIPQFKRGHRDLEVIITTKSYQKNRSTLSFIINGEGTAFGAFRATTLLKALNIDKTTVTIKITEL